MWAALGKLKRELRASGFENCCQLLRDSERFPSLPAQDTPSSSSGFSSADLSLLVYAKVRESGLRIEVGGHQTRSVPCFPGILGELLRMDTLLQAANQVRCAFQCFGPL